MARYVLPVVGAAVGFMVGGGPTGAMWGWSLGAAVGGLVDPQVIKGPSIGDIAQQTSQEGVPRPIVFGMSQPIAGNVIASGPPRIVKERSSGKGGPKVESESVYRTYAIRICEGPVSLIRAWRNNKLVYDIRENSEVSYADNNKFLEKARFFNGTFEQGPSPDLEIVFGVGTTPTHRGTAYLVMADELLNDTGGAIPQWTFQVTSESPPETLLVAVASATTSSGIATSVDGEHWNVRSHPSASPSGVAYSPELNRLVVSSRLGTFLYSDDHGETWTSVSHGESWQDIDWSPELKLFCAVGTTSAITAKIISTSPDGIDWTSQTPPSGGTLMHSVLWDGRTAKFISKTNASQSIAYSSDGAAWFNAIDDGEMSNGSDGSILSGEDFLLSCNGQDMAAYVSGDALTWNENLFDPDGTGEIGSAAIGKNKIAYNGTTVVAVNVSEEVRVSGDKGNQWALIDRNDLPEPGVANLRFSCLTWSATLSKFIAILEAAATPASGVLSSSGGGDWVLHGEALPPRNWTKVISAAFGGSSVDLKSVVSQICIGAGLAPSMFDVSLLPDTVVPGLTVINTYPSYSALQALGQVYFFAPAYYDGVVHFVPAGGNVEATITEGDMVDDRDIDIELSQRDDSITVPRVMHLNYYDINGGLATDKQTNERPGDRRAQGEQSLSSPVLMESSQAARAVAINHKVAIEELRGSIKFSLPDSWLALVPTNPIIVQSQGRSRRCRITKLDLLDGYQEYEAYFDRQSAYTSDVEGIPAAPQTPPPSGIVGPTLIEPLDIHILRDADDNVGLSYYVAISGSLAAWNGALVELSIDGGLNYIDSMSSSVSSIIGILEATLPDHPQAFPDEEHTLSINIQTPNGDLQSTDLAGMLNGANLAIVGNELIQFGTADETTEGHWELTNLLRGRKGTQTQQHEVGERFVLLTRSSLGMIPASIADISRTFTFRATSFGDTVDNATITTMTYAGISQTEREVGYLQARRDGTDAVVSWQGIGRLGGGAQVAQGARFTGYRVRFEGSDSGDTTIVVDTTNQAIMQDVSTLTAPVRIVVVQLNSLTGEGPETEVYI